MVVMVIVMVKLVMVIVVVSGDGGDGGGCDVGGGGDGGGDGGGCAFSPVLEVPEAEDLLALEDGQVPEQQHQRHQRVVEQYADPDTTSRVLLHTHTHIHTRTHTSNTLTRAPTQYTDTRAHLPKSFESSLSFSVTACRYSGGG